MPPTPPDLVRRYGTAFAVVLAVLAAWIIATESIRPHLPYFPKTTKEVRADGANLNAARIAAWIGWPRGQRWTDYAIAANADGLQVLADTTQSNKANRDKAPGAIAETAAILAPYDARAWLILAQNEQAASHDAAAQARLKMSYYTSPYRDDLFPLRIRLVAQMPSNADAELSSYADYELRTAMQSSPPLRADAVAAYRVASPGGRKFFDQAFAKLDPALLAELKAQTH
ncbi:MAG: hypothetical protein GC182_13365 [Rhodopseudomonas sp.]|nr:hypothetical protein [Rhodopseudomonas sp.]